MVAVYRLLVVDALVPSEMKHGMLAAWLSETCWMAIDPVAASTRICLFPPLAGAPTWTNEYRQNPALGPTTVTVPELGP